MRSPLGTPPGPVGVPLIGVARRFRKDPAGFLLATAREFGDVAYFRVGLRRVYLVSRPDLVEEVLVHSTQYFNKPSSDSPALPPLGPQETAAGVERAISEWQAAETVDLCSEIQRIVYASLGETPRTGKSAAPGLDDLLDRQPSFAARLTSAAVWVFATLAQKPEVQSRVRNETRDNNGSLPFTTQVITESLRLYPPVWTLARVTRSQFRLFNYLVPNRSVLLLSAFVTQRHSRLWPEPDRFDPSRFSSPTEERPRFAMFPFGVLAENELHAYVMAALSPIVTAVLHRWQLRLETNQVIEPAGGLLLWPRDPVNVVVSRVLA